MKKVINWIIWSTVFCVGVLISYLRIGSFYTPSFFVSMGMIFVLFCAVPTFISSGLHYYFTKKNSSSDDILDEEIKREKPYWRLFYKHLIIVSILIGMYKYFRPLLEYEINGL